MIFDLLKLGSKIDVMLVTKCDLCKKGIAREKIIMAGLGYKHFDLCHTCGAPVLDFLKKNNLPDDPMDKIKSFIKKEKKAR